MTTFVDRGCQLACPGGGERPSRARVAAQSIGEAFYTELGEAAPDMIHLFSRPKTIPVRPPIPPLW